MTVQIERKDNTTKISLDNIHVKLDGGFYTAKEELLRQISELIDESIEGQLT